MDCIYRVYFEHLLSDVACAAEGSALGASQGDSCAAGDWYIASVQWWSQRLVGEGT